MRGLPAPRFFMSVGAALLALALAARRMDAAGVTLLAGCAAVQAWPVLAAVVADSLDVAFPRFFWAQYGLNVLGFGVLAAWLALAGAGARGEARGS